VTQTLRDSLRDLADDAPIAEPRPGTWARARRSRHRRIVGGAAAGTAGLLVVIVTAVGMVAPTLTRSGDSTGQPQYDVGDLALPTKISQPSSWESGTDSSGPLGPIAVLGEDLARHTSWFHTTDSYYGISAVDGAYRYLDLPNLAPSGNATLSPDGLHVAYWTTAPDTADSADITGYAIYDAASGRSTEHRLRALGDLRPRQLVWSPAGDRVLAIYAGVDPPHRGNRVVRAETVGLGDDATHDLQLPAIGRSPDTRVAWGADGIAFWKLPSIVVVDPDSGATSQSVVGWNGAYRSSDLTASPDGSELAVTALFRDPGGPFLQVNSIGVFGAPLHGRQAATRESITRVSRFDGVYAQLGWRDDEHVLVLGVPTEQQAARADSVPGIYSIDVATGDYEELASVSLSEDALLRGIATGLALPPFADRPGPAGHPDPRAVWARLAALLFVVAMVVLVARQSRRANDPARPLTSGTA
jgi:hypothetical protein